MTLTTKLLRPTEELLCQRQGGGVTPWSPRLCYYSSNISVSFTVFTVHCVICRSDMTWWNFCRFSVHNWMTMVGKAAKLSESALTLPITRRQANPTCDTCQLKLPHTSPSLLHSTISPLLFISFKLGVWLISFHENIAAGHCLVSWRLMDLIITGFFYKSYTLVCTYCWGSIPCWAGGDGFSSSKGPKMLPGRVERWEREAKFDWLKSQVGGASRLGYLTLCSIVAECVFQLVWLKTR